MVKKKMKKFAKAVRENDIARVEELTEEIIRERGGKKLELEEVSELNWELVEKIKENGINTVEKLTNSSMEELVMIPELREGKAEEVLESARKRLVERLTELPGVGKGTAREILKHRYATLQDIERASVEELSEIPKIGEKSAAEIKSYAEKNSETDLEDLPKVGEKTAEEMRKNGFTAMQYVAESSLEELTKIPNLGAKGAEEILEYSKENPHDGLEDLPGVGEETAEKLKRRGFTVVHRVASASVEELAEVPNISEESAREIKEYAIEKLGGKIKELSGLSEETIEELKKHEFYYIGEVAKSSIEELVKIPNLQQGQAKELLESAEERWEESGEIKGYRRALEGVSSALKSDASLELAQKIADGKCSEELLERMKDESASKISHEFRPPKERGFNEAWRDILAAVLAIEGD